METMASKPGRTNCVSVSMSGAQCDLIAAKLKEEEKTNPDRRKVLERTIVASSPRMQRYHWGTVQVAPSRRQGAIYLAKGSRFRVRVEGWVGDVVKLEDGWEFCDPNDCNGQIVIAVWSSRPPEETIWGPPPMESGHEHTYWIEYVGPRTGASPRRAGPFGCTIDPVDHAMSDAGFSQPGWDGGYVLLDPNDNVVESNS
jgi:hypothetical protein